MPRYLVERRIPEGLLLEPGAEGRRVLSGIVTCNSDRNVTWIHSYVSMDRRRTFCVYDAPSPEAIRLSGQSNGLPVERITEVSVLDPYAYHVAPHPENR